MSEYQSLPVEFPGPRNRRPTARQLFLLRWLAETWRADIDPPTIRGACAALGVSSTNAIACLLTRLRAKELVRDAAWSSMRLTAKGYQVIGWKRCSCGAWGPPDA